MTNSKLLRKFVEERGVKYQYLAALIGITPNGLKRKIDNVSEFKASEIHKLSKALSLSDTQREAIFFAESCDFKSL